MANAIARRRLLLWAATIGSLLAACGRSNSADRSSTDITQTPQTFKLTSPAFEADAFIPAEFTCDGADQSPALSWETPPSQTQSLALFVEDPDAPSGTFVHWVVYDLPTQTRSLPAAIPNQPFLTPGGVQSKNDFGQYGYRGPCPPSGTHRYFFKLYAVDIVLDLPPGTPHAKVSAALKGHILAEAELIGRYSRQR